MQKLGIDISVWQKGFNFDKADPAANWLKARLISYASGEDFCPADTLTEKQLTDFINTKVKKAASNTNFAFNANDKTATRKKR